MLKYRVPTLACGIAIGFMAASAFVARPALAYRAARIATDEADVKNSPDPNAPTTSTLTEGTRVNTSDRTVNGYYRVRSANSMGWLPASALDFGNGAPPAPPTQASQPRPETIADQAPYQQLAPTPHPWAMKALAGFDFFSPTNINNAVGSTGLNTGAGFGGQIQYGLNATWAIALRIEHISKTTSGPDNAGNTIDLSVSSTPVMVGIDWLAMKGQNLALDLSVFGGEGLSTQVTATNESISTSNVTTYSASAPTALLAADLNWIVSDPFWIFGELGYRLLDTSSVAPSVNGTNSGGIFSPTHSASNVPNLDINLGGLVLNLGVRINF